MLCSRADSASLSNQALSLFRRALLAVAILLPAVAAAQTGSVTGTVTDSSTGLPIANVTVRVVTIGFQQVGIGTTDASGVYTASGVPPGALYFVRASPPGNYVDEIYPDVKAFRNFFNSTQLNEATSISVAGSATVSGIDFALDPGGSIAGTITNASGGGPLASVSVIAITRAGTAIGSAGSAFTNASGVYTFVGLPPGDYFLYTSNNLGFRNEIYDNVPCLGGCQTNTAASQGTPIAVGAGATVSGRDFALDPGGSITGTVTNAATGAPVQNVLLQAYTRVGTTTVFGGSASTNASGEYTIQGLASGTYGVLTSSSVLTNEIYDNTLCPLGCSSTAAVDSGAGVAVTLGAPTSGVNFALDPGGSISGMVTNEATGLPAASVSVFAAVRAGNIAFTRGATTNASGVYTITGLPTGTYALFTSSSQFANEIYDNLSCAALGGSSNFCSTTTALNAGTPVPVTSGATTSGRDFALQPLATLGSITGTVTDATSGLPIAGINVETWRQVGTGITSAGTGIATTNVAGVYTVTGLTAGSYRADTFGNHTYRNEIFDNLPCLGSSCPPSSVVAGTPIAVTTGAATADFALSKGDGISGTITAAATGLPLAGVNVSLYQLPAGTFAGSASTNVAGAYFLRGVPNGTYVALTSNSLGYRNEIYDNIPCTVSCSVTTAIASGTQITVSGAAAFVGGVELVAGINFALDTRSDPPAAPSGLRVVTTGFTSQFTWNAPSLFSGGAPTSYLLEAGLSPGTTFVSLPIAGTGTSFAVPGVPPGTYYVRVRGVNGFGTGPASNEVTLVVGAAGVALPEPPTNLIAFISGGLLTMTWSPPLGGGPPAGYVVEAGSVSGAANIATLNVTAATFSYNPVPPGFYFLRVRSLNAAGASAASQEVMVVVGNVPAPPSAPSLSHSVSGSTVNLSWSAPAVGTATSYIVEAGSAPGLSNLAVVNTGSAALSQSFTGVPPGTYYVRVRAVNAQGASVASNERIVVVS